MYIEEDNTTFEDIYDVFLGKITDDMYMELSVSETEAMLQSMLISALQYFEFPRFNKYDYDIEEEEFNLVLTDEEINIIATYMVVEWLGLQVASIELVRQQVTGSDFKLTSQAQHMSKVQALKTRYAEQGFHLQRLYKRRKIVDNKVVSTFGDIMKNSTGGYRYGERHKLD